MGENDPVTEKSCKETQRMIIEDIRRELSSEFTPLKDELMKFRILWHGNGNIGYKDKIERMWECYEKKARSTQGWIDWAFRLIIVLALGWLGFK